MAAGAQVQVWAEPERSSPQVGVKRLGHLWAPSLLLSALWQTLGLELVAVSLSACPVTPAQAVAGLLSRPRGKEET